MPVAAFRLVSACPLRFRFEKALFGDHLKIKFSTLVESPDIGEWRAAAGVIARD